jgi:nitrous oxide reductase accessory protein NosL
MVFVEARFLQGTEEGKGTPMKFRRAAAFFFFLPFLLGAPGYAQDDIKDHPSCRRCGMDRQQFSHSRMLLEFGNGEKVGTCSLRCMALELKENAGRKTRTLKVADYDSRTLLDAEMANWVIGGDVRGVMTKRAKWAFRDKDAARNFTRISGGDIASFLQALQAANEDLEAEGKRR